MNKEAIRRDIEAAVLNPPEGRVANAWLHVRLASSRLDLALETKPMAKLHAEVKDLYQMHATLFWAYCHPENWTEDGKPREYLPAQFAKWWAKKAQYLVAAECPPDFDVLMRQGRPAAGPDERQSIGTAVAYVLAARSKLIEDFSPISTVSKAYKVEKRTIYRWIKEFDFVEVKDFLHGVPPSEHGAKLTELFRVQAQHYAIAGRGSAAIRERASKRKPAKK